MEVRNAIESLNAVGVIERQLGELDPKIEAVVAGLNANRDEHYSSMPEAPDMPEEHKSDLRLHRKHAGFAGWKAQAQEATKRFRGLVDRRDS